MYQKGFVNIQAVVKEDFKAEFEEAFQSSGANSKGEFLRILIANYLSPDYEGKLRIIENQKNTEIQSLKEIENQKNIEIQNLTEKSNILQNEVVQLQNTIVELQDVENDLNRFFEILKPLFQKTKNQTITVDKQKIVINNEFDLLKLVVNCFKIK